MEEESLLSLFAWSCWQVHPFTGAGAHFLGILVYTEDQLRYPAPGTEKLLNSWAFYWKTAMLA